MRALTELKKECFIRIGSSSCFCCPEDKLKRLLAHHLSYTSKSVTYNKWGNSDDERLKYYSNLLDEIKEDKDNFLVMCFNCHKELERLLKLTFEEVKQSIQTIINKNIIFAYNITRKKRGLETLENPDDEISPPQFLVELFDFISCVLVEKEEIKNKVMEVAKKIEGKELSILDYSLSGVLSQHPQNYINPLPPHVIAARQLETIQNIKQNDNILFVRIINKPYYKPVELVRKEEIDSSYYMLRLEIRLKNIFNGVFNENEFDIMLRKPQRLGLDEFFWS